MFLRVDKLQIDLPAPTRQDPNAAAALQELLGGKYGEMSTPSAFTPDYAPEEMYEIAAKLYKASRK